MTVQELIDKLNKIDDKSMKVVLLEQTESYEDETQESVFNVSKIDEVIDWRSTGNKVIAIT